MGVLLLSTVAGSAFWVNSLQSQIGALKGNQMILEAKIQEQNEAIETGTNSYGFFRKRKARSDA